MSFPRYPKYKASGVEWLGEVPAHWALPSVRRLLARIEQGWSPECDARPAEPGEWGVLKAGCVNRGTFDPNENKVLPSDNDPQADLEVRPGDLLMSRASGSPELVGSTALVRSTRGRLMLSDKIFRLHAANEIQPAFLAWSFGSRPFRHQIERAISGGDGLANNLPQSALLGFVCPCPSQVEQLAIAAFLDQETAKIDALVAEQQRLIKLLKEKRLAAISHAVTKGLDPNAKMKPSGIEWLGDVPAHWEVKRLKHVSPLLSVGIVINPSSLVADEGLPFIYGGDIREGVIDWGNARRITPEASNLHAKTVLKDGDLLVVRVGAPGVTAVVPAECAGGNCASVMLMRRGSFNSRWLCSLMNTRVVRFQVEGVQYGAAQEQFNISDAVNFWVPVPPRDEQDQIQAHCDNAAGQFDKLIEGANMAITLLQERRTALISAAVTGQIDVRNFGAATAAS